MAHSRIAFKLTRDARLIFDDTSLVADVRAKLTALGCSSEASNLARFLAVDIKPDANFEEVIAYLAERMATGVLEYEDGCLQHAAASDAKGV